MKKFKFLGMFAVISTVILGVTTKVEAAPVEGSKIFSDFNFNLEQKEDGTYVNVSLVLNGSADKNNFYPTLLLVDEATGNERGYPEFRVVNPGYEETLDGYNNATRISDASEIKNGTILFLYTKVTEENIKNVYIDNWFIKSDRTIQEKLEYTNNSVNLIYSEDITEIEKFWSIYEKDYPFLGSCESPNGVYEEDTMYVCYELNNKTVHLGSLKLKGKTAEQLLAEVSSLVDTGKIIIDENNSILKSEELTQIKNNKVITTYEKNANDKFIYSWAFDGNKITDENKNININLAVEIGNTPNKDKIDALVPSSLASLKLDFKHTGSLPNGTSVKINVGDTFKNEDVLDLFYYNPEKNTLEKVSENIIVIDGIAAFPLSHCSEYVLVLNNEAKKVDNNVQTSSMNVILYAIISLVSAASIGYIIKSKNQEIV